MPNPVVHFEVIGADNSMNYGVVEAQGSGIGGGVSTGDGAQSFVTFYIEVDDPQAYRNKVVAQGGKVAMPVTEVPGFVTLAQLEDPEGHLIGIVKAGSM